MSTQRDIEFVRRFYAEVGSGDYTHLENLVSEDYLDHNDPAAGRGPQVVRAHMEGIRNTLSGFSLTIDDVFAEGEYVITRVSGVGIHTGEWMGIQPTGKTIHVKAINIDRVRDGQVVEHWGEADSLGMLLQMGIDPFPDRRG